MFEKEAEEYTENPKSAWKQGMTCVGSVRQAFKDGAKFGYNKANEWHFTNRNKEHLVIDCPKGEENKGIYKKMADLDTALEDCTESLTDARIKIKELEKELEQAKKVQVVEHFEAYGQCRDSRRIASLETENAELKDKLKNLESVAEVRLANWQKYEQENAELKAINEEGKAWVKLNEKLSKAKGFIEKLLIVSCNSEILIQYPNCKEVLEARVALEQFLMEK